jgi:transcriptional regulator with XRE-family HTH domain
MVNIDKIKTLAKSKGISISFICGQFGAGRGYLNDIARGKNTMSDDRIFKVARLLGTTYDYLTDLTDDPDPNYAAKQAESPEEKLIHKVIERTMAMTSDQIDTLDKIFSMEDDDLDHILSVLKVMGEK